MNTLETMALIVVGLWLGALTLVVILSVRQIGLLSVRLSRVNGTFSFADDGPEVGSRVPEEVIATSPELEHGRTSLLLLSATCGPCRELATELSGHRFERAVTALITGNEELADGLVALLPPGIGIVRDPDAGHLAKALQVKSSPFALVVEDGTIIRKAYMYRPIDFLSLVEGESTSDRGTHASEEVRYVG
jgi:hypothetical protein